MSPSTARRPSAEGKSTMLTGRIPASRTGRGSNLWSDADQTLAEVLAAIEPRDRTRRLLDPVEDVLSIAQLSVADPALELEQCRGALLDMVEDEKTFYASAFDQNMARGPRPLGWGVPARNGCGTADDHACSDVETCHDRVGDRPGGVVEVDIDAL